MNKILLKIFFRIILELKYLKFRIIDKISNKEISNYFSINSSYNQSVDNAYSENKICHFKNHDSITLNEYNIPFKHNLNRTLKHEFNLLGSGWKNLDFQNSNLNESIRIKNQISLKLNFDSSYIDNYVPIDWQLDFKSGFRWNEKTWYMDVPIGKKSGTDIKVPWELSRLQHLPQLALLYKKNYKKENLALECILQITDWIVSNRVRFGVNWRTSMEVGIRACNMLLTYELIRKSKYITNEFKKLFEISLHEHGSHIKNNLETSYFFHGHNHYMANIVGLIFLGISTNNKDSEGWLKFGIKEFNKAVDFQFYEDGGNFEGSGYYHRLVFEMVLHSVILISNNIKKVKSIIGSNEVLNQKTLQKFHNAFVFFKHIITPNFSLFQYGDNDSGRLFNLTGEKDKNINKFIVDLGDSFFYKHKHKSSLSNLFIKNTKKDSIKLKQNNIGDIKKTKSNGIFFPDSKIYVFNNEIYSSLVVLRPTTLGHTHNDLFSFELYAYNKPFIIDGGSYCYTSDYKLRNEFRSTFNHNTLWINGHEQNEFIDPFAIKGKSIPTIINHNKNSIEASHNGYLKEHKRKFMFRKNSLEIIDKFDGESYISLNIAPKIKIVIEDLKIVLKDNENVINLFFKEISEIKIVEGFYSKQYGKRIKNKRILLKRKSEFSKLKFKIDNC